MAKSALPEATYAFYGGRKVTIDDLLIVCKAKGALASEVKEEVALDPRRKVQSLPEAFAAMVRRRELRRKGFRQ